MRDTIFAMKVSESERQLIQAGARARGVTPSEHVRELAIFGSVAWIEATDEARSDREGERGA